VRSLRGAVPAGTVPVGTPTPLEMWAGVECTINRVDEQYRDQLALAGHYARPEDPDRVADLGVTTVRWPILWELHHENPEAWRHTDRVLTRFRERGVRVIAGLVHHGSGPRHTSLLDPAFVEGVAAFARVAAQRYPWIDAWTPINEPLTTARFAALYGVWYPHARNDQAFVRALVHQVLATQAAMAAIRQVTPTAILVATEDLGYTHSNAVLRYQAAFENERRWLTWDLLFGEVRRGHALWTYLCRSGPVRRLLERIADQAADPGVQPGIVGINHYVTSERFLDEGVSFYPAHTHGGNRWHRYADVEAVRVLRGGPLGPARLIEQAWARYGAPLAVTEAHLACTREQQMAWLMGMWDAAQEARARGADVRAVTAWAVLGSFDWRSLLTRDERAYETGAFDVRAPEPRATALVPLIRALASGARYEHPALAAEPWWTRADRLEYPSRRGTLAHSPLSAPAIITSPRPPRRPLLVVGAAGTLGVAFRRLARQRGLVAVALTRQELDITDAAAIAAQLDTVRPWAIVNAAGWVRVDDAEHQRDACTRANVAGAEALAHAAAARDLPFCTFSSDLVFGGSVSRPFLESDRTAPANWYGQSKALAERRVRRAHEGALVVRTSAFFGDWDDHNFVTRALARVQQGEETLAPHDAVVSPTYVTDLVHGALDLLIDGERGIWHLANVGACSWFDLARTAARIAGLDHAAVQPCRSREIGWVAPRPAYSVLGSERATLLAPLEEALTRHLRARAWERLSRRAKASPSASPSASANANVRAAVLRADPPRSHA
jgi:dTDP-4-dehydrorhamnose reductase